MRPPAQRDSPRDYVKRNPQESWGDTLTLESHGVLRVAIS